MQMKRKAESLKMVVDFQCYLPHMSLRKKYKEYLRNRTNFNLKDGLDIYYVEQYLGKQFVHIRNQKTFSMPITSSIVNLKLHANELFSFLIIGVKYHTIVFKTVKGINSSKNYYIIRGSQQHSVRNDVHFANQKSKNYHILVTCSFI